MTTAITQTDLQSYNLLLESVKDHAIIILDANGYVQEWSRGAHQVKGYTAEEIIGKHFSILYREEDVKAGLPEKNLQKSE
jgi:PAS domain S-box-containing protein